MKTYPFEEFMKSNQLTKEQLDPLLQKRIAGFEELREDMEHTVDGDRKKMEQRLEDLADELEEDIYEEFEDQLENNFEEQESEGNSAYAKAAEKEKLRKKLIAKGEKERAEKEKIEKERIEKEKAEKLEKAKELPSDESIIEKLYKAGQKKIGKSGLLEKGFKAKLEGKKIIVGKYKLVKALFSYSYFIEVAK